MKSPATVAASSSTSSSFDAIEAVEPKLRSDAPSFACAGIGVVLASALGLVVDCSAIEQLRASDVPAVSVHRNAGRGRDVYNQTSANGLPSNVSFRFDCPMHPLSKIPIASGSAEEHALDTHQRTRRQPQFTQRRVRVTSFGSYHDSREFLRANWTAFFFEALDVRSVEPLEQLGFPSVGLR